jgi:L-noviosyl transferase
VPEEGDQIVNVLFTCGPSEGHLNPMVPLAWAFRLAGHEVLVSTTENFAATVARAGLPAAVVAPGIDLVEWLQADAGPPPPTTPLERSGRRFGALGLVTLPGVREVAGSWRPDLIVCDPVEFAGPVVATERAVPWVRHWWGLPLAPEMLHAAEQVVTAELGAGWLGPAGVVHVCPASFRPPGTPAGLDMRYVPYNGASIIPDWLSADPPRPRVCLTLGTVLPRDPRVGPYWREVATGLAEAGLDVLVAIDEQHRGVLGELPNGVRAQRLPLAQALRSCAAVLHHGGSGTTMTAVATGVPQLVMPHFADQFANADRIDATGAGLVLPARGVDTPTVRDVVLRLVREEPYRLAAERLAEDNRDSPTPPDVVATLTKWAPGERGTGT